MSYRLIPLNEQHARNILEWRYPHPYDFYDPPDDGYGDHYVSQFLRPEFRFHAVVDADSNFVGFCSFGIDGQVPGGNYTEEALDIGLGMRPELTGRGLGTDFFAAIMQFAIETFDAGKIRLTVAQFNARALKLYENFGFVVQDEFIALIDEVPYTILVRNK